MKVPPLFPSRSRKAGFFYSAAFFSTAASMYAISSGPLGTGTTPAHLLYVLYGASLALFAGALLLTRWGSLAQALALAATLIAPFLLLVGVSQQNLVEGRPVLVFSELSRALDLADYAEEDRSSLLGDHYLLTLPRSQARAVAGDYEAAARRSLEIAARWNPATARELPGQGFEEVHEILNAAADAQADAMRAYIANVESPQDALAEAAEGLFLEAERLLSSEMLGRAISDARSGSIALLRGLR